MRIPVPIFIVTHHPPSVGPKQDEHKPQIPHDAVVAQFNLGGVRNRSKRNGFGVV
jgi:hypothetical protein